MNSISDFSHLPEAIVSEMTSEPNEQKSLYEGVIKVQTENNLEFLGNGKLYLSWFPKPQICFELECDHQAGNLLVINKVSLSIERDTQPELFEAKISNHNLSSQGKQTLKGYIFNHELEREKTVQKVKFYLCNFCDYSAEPIRDGNSGTRRHRLTLESDQWRIKIDLLRLETTKVVDLLKDEGGYAFTHVAIIEKKDGSNFTLETVEELLSTINYFLSFLAGQWVSPFFYTGYDSSNEECWRKWNYFHTDIFSPRNNWFPKRAFGKSILDINTYVISLLKKSEILDFSFNPTEQMLHSGPFQTASKTNCHFLVRH